MQLVGACINVCSLANSTEKTDGVYLAASQCTAVAPNESVDSVHTLHADATGRCGMGLMQHWRALDAQCACTL